MPRTPRHRRPARASRLDRALVWMLAAVTALAGVVTAQHQASTRHVTCAEHGIVVHAATAAAAPTTAVDLADASRADPIPGTELHHGPQGEQGAAHDHCRFPPAVTARVDAPLTIATRARAVEPVAVTPARVVASVDGTDVYRGAPKTSPPA